MSAVDSSRELLRAEINRRRREELGLTPPGGKNQRKRTLHAAQTTDPVRYQRVREACCDQHGGVDLDLHAADITLALPPSAPNANGQEPAAAGAKEVPAPMASWTDPPAPAAAQTVTLRIISDPIENVAVFYCTLSGHAFGPGMTCDEADGFLHWILSGAASRAGLTAGVRPLDGLGFHGRDPREYTADDLARLLTLHRKPRTRRHLSLTKGA